MSKRKPNATKAGTSAKAAAARKDDFARAYIANGKNATRAAIEAGYSPRTARQQGARLLSDVALQAAIAEMEAKFAERAGLSIERTLREVARLAYADPRRLFREDGSLIPIREMDDDTAATIASIEHETKVDRSASDDGDGIITNMKIAKLKTWDKNAALEKAMKHLGLFREDNQQQGRESLVLKVEVAQAKRR